MVGCILPRTVCEEGFGTLCIICCVWMTASNAVICFPVWPVPETAMGILCNCQVGALPYKHCGIRSSPLCGAKVLHPAQYDLTRPSAMTTAKNTTRTNTKTVFWLSSSRSDWRDIQRCCQPMPTQPIYLVYAGYTYCLLYTSPSPRD